MASVDPGHVLTGVAGLCLVVLGAACSEAAPQRSERSPSLRSPISSTTVRSAGLATGSLPGAPAPGSSATIDPRFDRVAAPVSRVDAAVPLLALARASARIAPGQAVWWQGMVGTTIESPGEGVSVRAVTDIRSRIQALVEGKAVRGVVSGNGAREPCRVEYVSRSDEVRVGDRMVTAGAGQTVPEGLLICTVTLVQRREYGVYQEIECAPAVDLTTLQQVLVLVPPGTP